MVRKSTTPTQRDSTMPVSQTGAEMRFDTIYTTLRSRICLLDYAPGTRLAEEALAQEFSVSRTPVRRVLGRLEVEGLVEIRHGVGTLVTDVDLNYLCDVYQLRMEMVPYIGLLSPNPVTDDLLARMRQTQARCRLVSDAENPRRLFSQINIEFFEQLMELVGNRALHEMCTLMFYRSARMWPYLMHEADIAIEAGLFSNEIGEVVQMLESGHLTAIGNLRRTHIAMALQRLKLMAVEQ